MNFRITYLHNILYIKKERKGKKIVNTYRQTDRHEITFDTQLKTALNW